MRAVSNTSPISNLAIIGRLSLLKSQFSELWIPPAVFCELAAHPDNTAVTCIQEAIQNRWIQVSPPLVSPLLGVLSSLLHRGETEAITLAAELKADRVIIDERQGRELASRLGLSVVGVMGVLLRAKANGEIKAIKPEIQALRSKARFFVAKALESEILAAAGE